MCDYNSQWLSLVIFFPSTMTHRTLLTHLSNLDSFPSLVSSTYSGHIGLVPLPQDLCTCYFHCLDGFSPGFSTTSASFPFHLCLAHMPLPQHLPSFCLLHFTHKHSKWSAYLSSYSHSPTLPNSTWNVWGLQEIVIGLMDLINIMNNCIILVDYFLVIRSILKFNHHFWIMVACVLEKVNASPPGNLSRSHISLLKCQDSHFSFL